MEPRVVNEIEIKIKGLCHPFQSKELHELFLDTSGLKSVPTSMSWRGKHSPFAFLPRSYESLPESMKQEVKRQFMQVRNFIRVKCPNEYNEISRDSTERNK